MGKKDQIAVILLAAGESSRMRQPKQLLPWGDTTLLGHAIKVAQDSNAQDVYVVLGGHAQTIQEQLDLSHIKCILNKNWKKGLGTSIACAVKHLAHAHKAYDGLLFMLGDQPLIDAQVLNTMLRAFSQGNKGMVATKYPQGNGTPVLFHKKFFGFLKELDGDKGAKEIIANNSDDVIALAPDGKEVDLDTYAEYQQLKQQLKPR
ncbi:MAG: nucleotidyltransferase family protein [Maribacter sp.]|uniref:nucleotidyltransferase family protein n=1 Tax=Maribacter sp. TaxID=1897614 RepID=UPI003C7777F6